MLGQVLKRVVNAAVVSAAAVTFFLVPVGRKTLAHHLVAICTTRPAREAAAACADMGSRVAERAKGELDALRRRDKGRRRGPPPRELPADD